jgi:ABC-type phosphate transport system substrate-binding protein
MKTSLRKRIVRAPLALSVGLGTLLSMTCCLAFTDASAVAATPAGEPPTGLACQASDGKISGRGATYQEVAQQSDFSVVYTQTFCGKEVAEQFAGDPAKHTMIAYNYPAAAAASGTGSGAGQKAASCRTDAFAGSDIPYTVALIKEENEAPGKLGGCAITFEPPFQPKPTPWPNAEDHAAKLMSFPVAGSSEALIVHLTAAGSCAGNPPPTSIQLTGKEVSRIFGGDAKNWNDAEIVASQVEPNKAALEKCTGVISRVVRQDNSGTTNIFKQFLIRADNERTGATCAPGHPWEPFNTAPNTNWPHEAEGGTCSALVVPEKSGNAEVVAKTKATEGAIGYADLAQAVGQGLTIPTVRNATNTSFQPPNIGKAANCTFSALSLPGANAEEAVGLNTEDDWANNNDKPIGEGGNEKPNHENATDIGTKYPICGITFQLVYTHDESSTNPEVAIKRLTADQRMTLYSYMSFLLSSTGQDILSEDNYAPLPSLWLKTLREGFQANF